MNAQKVPFYNTRTVSQAAEGRWLEVLAALGGGALDEALRRPGFHVKACPCCGQVSSKKSSGFRLFKDAARTGGGYCNDCGAYPSGFKLLQAVTGKDFPVLIREVAEYLRIDPEKWYYPKGSRPERSQVVRDAPLQESVSVVARTSNVVPFGPSAERLEQLREMQERLHSQEIVAAAQAEERLAAVWGAGKTLAYGLPDPVYRYWQSRNLLQRSRVLAGDNIRFHEALPYYGEVDGKQVLVGEFPALLLAVRDIEGNLVTCHRTYLSPEGEKAPVDCPRKLMAAPGRSLTGCAIQLGGMPADGALGVAEGAETAMAVLKATGIPTWSTVSAGLLAKFEPPKGVKTLLIWADKDRSFTGEDAANELRARMLERGLKVWVLMPPVPIPEGQKGVDWNDVMIKQGIGGFPPPAVMRRLLGGES